MYEGPGAQVRFDQFYLFRAARQTQIHFLSATGHK